RVVRRKFEFDIKAVIVCKLYDIVAFADRRRAFADVSKLGVAFPAAAQQVVQTYANPAAKIRDLRFRLIYKPVVVAVEHPTRVADVRLDGCYSLTFEIGPLFSRKGDHVRKFLIRNNTSLANETKTSLADKRSYCEIFVASHEFY